MFKKKMYVAGLVVGLLVTTAACGGDDEKGADGKSLTKIVQVNADPGLGATTAFHSSVPEKLGYFKEEGLSVETRGVQGADAAAAMVQSGQADIVQAGGPAMVQFAGDKDDSLVAVYLNKSHSFRFVVPEDSDIKTAADLKGATIGVLAMAGPMIQYGKAVVSQGGLDPEKDVKFLPVGLGTQAAAAFEKGQIQAYAGADSFNSVIGQLTGQTMRVISVPSDTLPAFGGWLVRREMIEKNPEAIIGFIRATLKGLTFANANPEAAVKIHWERYPTSKAADGDKPEVLAQWAATIKERIDLAYLGKGPDGFYGTADEKDLAGSLQFQVDAGILPKMPDLKQLVDLEFAKQYNDFDESGPLDSAKNY
ncbi:ABC transporter substrate-binding protein [Nocardioides marmoriginsengisoli]|nr:ABC transporter substrate-binding protein [Nocardioides marmoriginsengisoli]